MKITVIGMGRLGVPYLTALAELGHNVLGLDINPETLAALQAGRCPFDEPGITHYIAKHIAAGQLRFTDSYDEAAAHGDVFFLAVPTPQREGAMTMDLERGRGGHRSARPLYFDAARGTDRKVEPSRGGGRSPGGLGGRRGPGGSAAAGGLEPGLPARGAVLGDKPEPRAAGPGILGCRPDRRREHRAAGVGPAGWTPEWCCCPPTS